MSEDLGKISCCLDGIESELDYIGRMLNGVEKTSEILLSLNEAIEKFRITSGHVVDCLEDLNDTFKKHNEIQTKIYQLLLGK